MSYSELSFPLEICISLATNFEFQKDSESLACGLLLAQQLFILPYSPFLTLLSPKQ